MHEYDVAIVGGGPIGGFIADKISKKGFNVALYEEHKNIGEPLKCAGLVSSRVFDIVDVKKENIIQNSIKGAHIHSPSGQILTIGGDKVHALVINRSMFDYEIIKQAMESNTEVFLENKIISAKKSEDHIKFRTSKNNKNIRCKLLVGADGPFSTIRKWFNFSEPTEILKGIGAEITNTNLDPNFVEIFLGRNVAPGFFAWIIPTNKSGTKARTGLCISPDMSNFTPKHFLLNLFKNKQFSDFFKNVEITKRIGGAIPLGPLKKTYADNMLLVGDAAAQVKPTSGGGIYTGLLCASHCITVAEAALQKNNFSQQILKKYQKMWSADIGKELNRGMRFRTIFKNLTDKQIDKYIEKFQNLKTIDIISKYGDIDYPSKLAIPLLKTNPSILKLLPKTLKKNKGRKN